VYLTGFADEASGDINGQILATKALLWENIEARNVNGKNIHDISEEEFEKVYKAISESGVSINCFGSAIANWGKDIREPFQISIDEAKRAILRMKKLGTKLIRIMSYAVIKENSPENQMKEERFRRLRELKNMFDDNDITMVHENCMNYGGMGYTYTLELMENVPGLRLVFDTGNPVQSVDYSADKNQMQSSIDFYSYVKEHIEYIHIKDGIYNTITQNVDWCFPGEGQGFVREILTDLIQNGFEGGISIEPHINIVQHQNPEASESENRFNNYVKYGKMLEKIVKEIKV